MRYNMIALLNIVTEAKEGEQQQLRVLDAKVSFDSNSLFRHPDVAALREQGQDAQVSSRKGAHSLDREEDDVDGAVNVSVELTALFGDTGPGLPALIDARHAVEVGVFTGYSSICIARGLAAGGGWGMAVGGDLVICSENTEFQVATLNLGSVPDGRTTTRPSGQRRMSTSLAGSCSARSVMLTWWPSRVAGGWARSRLIAAPIEARSSTRQDS